MLMADCCIRFNQPTGREDGWTLTESLALPAPSDGRPIRTPNGPEHNDTDLDDAIGPAHGR